MLMSAAFDKIRELSFRMVISYKFDIQIRTQTFSIIDQTHFYSQRNNVF